MQIGGGKYVNVIGSIESGRIGYGAASHLTPDAVERLDIPRFEPVFETSNERRHMLNAVTQ